MNPRERLKWGLVYRRGAACEALEFWPHECKPEGSIEMHEILFTRYHAMKSKALAAYIVHEINCGLFCTRAHNQLQHSRKFRTWWRDTKQPSRYGSREVVEYVEGWPGRVMA